MTTRSKRIVASLLAFTLAFAPLPSQSADLNAEMQAMFNDLGALGNVTSPGAFRGQAMNLYTGGSLMMRSPGRNYPLVNAQLPSLRAGCGGIDLFGGGKVEADATAGTQQSRGGDAAREHAALLPAGHALDGAAACAQLAPQLPPGGCVRVVAQSRNVRDM